jgi:hypothetical protein
MFKQPFKQPPARFLVDSSSVTGFAGKIYPEGYFVYKPLKKDV